MLYHVFAGSNWYPNGGAQDFLAFLTRAIEMGESVEASV